MQEESQANEVLFGRLCHCQVGLDSTSIFTIGPRPTL